MNNYTEEFERLWVQYPKRAGGNPKPKAFKAFTARLKEKVDYSELEAGLRRYSEFCKQTGILNTPYVMQASTFFSANTESWTEEWEIPQKEVKETIEQQAARKGITPKLGELMPDYIRRVQRG